MNKTYLLGIDVFALIAILIFLLFSRQNPVVKSAVNVGNANALGIYSHLNTGLRLEMPDLSLHLKWQNGNKEELGSAVTDLISKSRRSLIIIETWPLGQPHLGGERNVLVDIIEGKYDQKIHELCKNLKGIEDKVYITVDPDVEVPVKNFPWQYQSPFQFIQAFRHLYREIKTICPKIAVIWTTAGYPGMEEYYPGNDVVDAINVNFFGRSEAQTNVYPTPSSTATLIKRKLIRTRFMNKPVLITSSGKEWRKSDKLSMDSATKVIDSNADILFRDTISKFAEEKGSVAAPIIGLYDPAKRMSNDKSVSVEHLFIDWASIEDGSLRQQITEINRRDRSALLTVEPWKGRKWPTTSDVLAKMLRGQYDEPLKKIFQEISLAKHPVYLRFAHEMEIPITRYPWQSIDPIVYIKAYRYFMAFADRHCSAHIKKVWGPAGDRGSLEWWPGNDVVDYVSFAIYGLPDKNITDPLAQETFADIFDRKANRMSFVNKPFFITEFGVKGPAGYQEKWLVDAAVKIKQSKRVYGISYFNFVDNPKVWGKAAAPNWAINKTTFHQFLRELRR